MRLAPLLVLPLYVSCWVLASCMGTPPPLTPRPGEPKHQNREPLPPEVESAMWRVKGDGIFDGKANQVTLRGIAFGNQVWENVAIPSAHHSGIDFERVADMGMNSVRFYLSYRTFEDDETPLAYKQAGWDWLDQNVDWAKDHGVRLVLNMHVPVGGFQSLGEGSQLWEDETIQDRFVALWQAIAERYRAEPTIAGYDLLNEPAPTKSIEQWKQLAERTIAAIRDVDQGHMVFVERVNAVGKVWSEDDSHNFFRVSDPNVVYEFHFYKPYHFTHQGAPWSEFAARESWYPDPNAVAADWFELKTEARAESESLPPGNSDWRFLETESFEVTDPDIVVGKPFLVCDAGRGRATFDSLSLTKIPAPAPHRDGGTFGSPSAKVSPDELPEPETLFEIDLDTRRGWYFWTENGEGEAHFEPRGQGDNTALAISGTTGPANLGSDPLRFFVEPGARYQLHGVATGAGLAEGSQCRLRLEFYSKKGQVHARDKEFLRDQINGYRAWAEEQGVPLYLGEFGTIEASFAPGRGGIAWVSDMLDIALDSKLHFAYHTYHEPAFGLFSGEGSLPRPSDLNQPLYDLFVEKLDGVGGLWSNEGARPSSPRGQGKDEALADGLPENGESTLPDQGDVSEDHDYYDFD